MLAAGRAPGRKHILEGSTGGTGRQRWWVTGSIPPLGAAASDSHLTYFSNYFYPDCSSWQVCKWQCDFVCCLQFPPLRVSRRESFDLARGGDSSQFSSVCECQLRCCERCSPGHRSLVTHARTHTHTRLTMLYSLHPLLHQEAKASARPHSAAHLFGGPYQLLMGFPGDASGKEPSCQCRRPKRCAIDPWVRKIPWGGHGNPFQYSCLENPMDRGAWWITVHRVAKSQTWLKRLSTHAPTFDTVLIKEIKSNPREESFF